MNESRSWRRGPRPGAGRGERAHSRILDPAWNPELVPAIARTFGLHALEDRHWKVIMSCREEAARTGHAPQLREISALTGFDEQELHRLFPGDFVQLVAHVSGLSPHA